MSTTEKNAAKSTLARILVEAIQNECSYDFVVQLCGVEPYRGGTCIDQLNLDALIVDLRRAGYNTAAFELRKFINKD